MLKMTNLLLENPQNCITKLSELKQLSHVQEEYMPINNTEKEHGKASERIKRKKKLRPYQKPPKTMTHKK